MVESVVEGKLTPQERLCQELLWRSNNSAVRMLEYAAKATACQLLGDEVGASNCQVMADVSATDAFQSAYEAGQIMGTNEEPKNISEDLVFIGYIEKAGVSIDLAVDSIMEAQHRFTEGEDPEEFRRMSHEHKRQALGQAFEAGKYMGNGKRAGTVPTLTLNPKE